MQRFSCGKVIGDKGSVYLELLARDMSEGRVLGLLGDVGVCIRLGYGAL